MSSDDPALLGDLKPSPNNSKSSKDSDVQREGKKAAASSSVDSPSWTKTQAAVGPTLSKPLRKNRPPKKRKFESEDDHLAKKSHGKHSQVDEPDEKSAVESLMGLSKNPI